MKRCIACVCFLAGGLVSGPALPLAAVTLAVSAPGCSVFRTFQNPDAKLIALYRDLTGGYDTVAMLLRMDRITPEVAQVAKDGLDIGLKHADAAKDIIIKARASGREPTSLEIKGAWSKLDLALDALDVVTTYLASKEKK